MANDVESQVEQAVANLDPGTKHLVRREIARLPSLLAPGEEIVHMAHGHHGDGQGLLVATDRRFVFIEDEIVRREFVDMPYETISDVQTEVNVVKSDLTITGPEGEVVINRVYPKGETMNIAEQVRRGIPGVRGHRLGHEPQE
jgi:hypothetical protein